MKLGDVVEAALKTVGITEERVSKFLGRPCNCRARREKLNKLHDWAKRVVGGQSKEEAEKQLDEIIEPDKK